MSIRYCINIADANIGRPPALQAQTATLDDCVRAFASEAGFPQVDRLEFGSSFCPLEFMRATWSKKIEPLKLFSSTWDVPLTLVVPIVNEDLLPQVKQRIAQLMEFFGPLIDEMVANDFGMLAWLGSSFEAKLSIGRLFSKDLRDPRYTDGFASCYRPALLQGDLAALKEHWPQITAAEFDPAGLTVDLSGTPEGIEPALHTPYFYATTGRICEAAAADGSGSTPRGSKRLRPDSPCRHQCVRAMTTYAVHPSLPDGSYDEDRLLYYTKRGKTVFCLNDGVRVVGPDGCEPDYDFRLVASPRHMGWLVQRQNDAATSWQAPAFTGWPWQGGTK